MIYGLNHWTLVYLEDEIPVWDGFLEGLLTVDGSDFRQELKVDRFDSEYPNYFIYDRIDSHLFSYDWRISEPSTAARPEKNQASTRSVFWGSNMFKLLVTGRGSLKILP